MTDVDLDVVQDWPWGDFQKVSQVIIHEFHQKHRWKSVSILVHTQVLNNVWVSYGAQNSHSCSNLFIGIACALSEEQLDAV